MRKQLDRFVAKLAALSLRKRSRVIAVILVAFAVIEVIKHAIVMRLGMTAYHVVSFFLDAGLTLGAVVLVYMAADRYTATLRKKNRALTQLNRQLVETEQLKDNLTAMIVHDLRNPLMGVQGGIDLLEASAESADPKRIAKYTAMIRSSKEDMLRMIDGLLSVTKLEAGELEPDLQPVVVRDLFERAAARNELAAGKAEMAVTVEQDNAELVVEADVDLIDRVLDNLIGNAFKYATDATGVWLRARGGNNGKVVLEVADDGPGIPEEHRKKIFDKFGTALAREAGVRRSTGLGLTFCKLAVEAHGGDISVADNLGGGSAFVFSLPAAPPEGATA